MAQRAIREVDGKRMLARLLPKYLPADAKFGGDIARSLADVNARSVQVAVQPAPGPAGDALRLGEVAAANPWLLTTRLVAKPDQLIKRRGKGGLLLLNATWDRDAAAAPDASAKPSVKEWLRSHARTQVTVDGVSGELSTFLVEPFVPHAQSDEYYICISSQRDGELILFSNQGGVDVGDVDAHAARLLVPCGETPSHAAVSALCSSVRDAAPAGDAAAQSRLQKRVSLLVEFILALFHMYTDAHFCYLEINPLVVTGDAVDGSTPPSLFPLDMAAKVDEAAAFLAADKWGPIAFPPPFGRSPEPEEAYIRDLDARTGASLKLTILNRHGRVWTMVAGGGASVVYADTISDIGFGHELANYGEYSGAPSEEQTYEYAKTILTLLAAHERTDGAPKVLIIGGGIANFTDVAKTFSGIIRALREAVAALHKHKVSIWVRRGGPNYQEGLRRMQDLGRELGVPIHVYGPDTHITAIVPLALGVADTHGLAVVEPSVSTSSSSGDGIPRVSSATMISGVDNTPYAAFTATPSTAAARAHSSGTASNDSFDQTDADTQIAHALEDVDASAPYNLFSPSTRCIVYGMQQRAVQGMLDFDWLCKRERPSVAAMVFPFSGNHYQKFYWGHSEMMMPVYASTEEAMRKHTDVTVFVNFASFRSVYQSTLEALAFPSIRSIAIIAEGVPEQQARLLLKAANEKGVVIIGPATVGGITPGCFRIGNTGGMLDNIISCKLYRPGSVAYVSKSGGMSNELNNIMATHTDGVCEGVAIGGDRYPGSRFIDHLLRYQANPRVKMMVLLGEVGGIDEYDVVAALRDGRITKPLVAWCIGTCAKMFPFEVQFGHAGALANSEAQTADAKNKALKAAGAVVPENFNDFVAQIRGTYQRLVRERVIVERPEPPPPKVPMDYAWAKQLGLIRKPAGFVSSVSDDRGEELLYAGVPITKVFEEDLGIGGVISLLWFQRRLPAYATKFFEMIIMVCADHGPAVAGAHNAIVAARAGKDVVSCLCSGLLTIGPRFGGALDEAAAQFTKAYDGGLSPDQFVKDMRASNQLIMGVGHRIKSVSNPDRRVVIIKEYAFKHFPSTDVLKYALEVEKITTSKKENLILNVDGAIAVCMVDLLRSCGAFTREEADDVIESGVLTLFFTFSRTCGLGAHILDQKRLKQGLYRHPWDDITYMDTSV